MPAAASQQAPIPQVLSARPAQHRVDRPFIRRVTPPAVEVAAVAVQPITRKPAVGKVKPPVVKPAVAPAVKKAPAMRTTVVVQVEASGSAAAVVAFVYSVVGRPYVYGAAGPEAFDCSGLVVAAYRRIGVSLPHKAAAFYTVGRAVPRSELRPGDIIVMAGGSHAGIYVGNGMMVHAPHPGARVELAPIWSFSAARRLVG